MLAPLFLATKQNKLISNTSKFMIVQILENFTTNIESKHRVFTHSYYIYITHKQNEGEDQSVLINYLISISTI